MLIWYESVLLALLGSAVHLGLACYEQEKLPSQWQLFGHLGIGPVAGYLFWLTKAPNHINAFFAGFFAIDFIHMLARIHKPSQQGR